MDNITLAVAKKYTEDSLMGAGALKGEKGENGLSIKALSITQDDTGKIVDATATLSDNSTIKVDIITNGTPDEERLEGDGAEYYTLAPTPLSFRSDAPLNELQDVQINGVTVDPSNYTLEEGSTIVTFPIDYLKTLEAGDYEVTIASESKSVKGGFTVAAPELNERGFYYNQPYTAYVAMLGRKVSFFVREDGTFDSITGSGGVETGTYEIVENTIVSNNSLGTLHSTISTDGTTIYCNEIETTFVLGDDSIVADEDYIYIYKEDLGGYEVTRIDQTKGGYGTIKTGINGIDTVKLARTYYNCDNLISVPLIPNTITTIGDYAFYYCDSLTSVTIPDSVTTIGNSAFYNCESLTSITIPGSVTTIGNSAFAICNSLTNVNLGNGITTIDNDVFNACNSLTNITFNGTTTEWSAINFGDNWNLNVPATHVQCSDGTVEL